MTISHVGEETTTDALPETVEPASPDPGQQLTPIDGLQTWQVEFREGLEGESTADEAGELQISYTGAGELAITATEALSIPTGTVAVQLWVTAPELAAPEQIPELFLQFDNSPEVLLGRLDFTGGHLLRHTVPSGSRITGLHARGLFGREATVLGLSRLALEGVDLGASPHTLPAPYGESPSMLPATDEEVTNSIEKDGISFIFESRSLSAVVRYVYTPIEGNLSDFEVEINNADAIKLSEDGGICVSMGGQEWSPADEEIERHFVSCEQVGEAVEARWQFRRGSELADFLYRVRIEGKSLLVELEGGGGKASGVGLGYVVGAIHPRLVHVPYLNFGDQQPAVLCTSGVFISSLLDWYSSRASELLGAPTRDDQVTHLNGGCTYRTISDGRRAPMHERWVLTVSRRFEEVLPTLPTPIASVEHTAVPTSSIWCQLPDMEAGEEAYIEAYERLRMFRQVGMNDLLVLHPESTWHDGVGGMPALDAVGAPAKGGDDALLEYLEAVSELGYEYALSSSFRHISPHDECWSSARVARTSDGELATTGPGRYLLRPTHAAAVLEGRVQRLVDSYGAGSVFLAEHTSQGPWDRLDCDAGLAAPASFLHTLTHEQALLAELARQGVPVIGDGGSHWLHVGLLSGHVARLRGAVPSEEPLLVDFDLRCLHGHHIDAGVGTPEQYFAQEVPEEERHGRSPWLDRYLVATLAFGHAGLLPDLELWGLPAVAKVYYLLRKLQTYYLGVELESIHYQRGGNLLETTEALVAGAHDLSQVRIVYANGLHVYVNGSREEDWEIPVDDDTVYRLPPASFLARGPSDLLVYSADSGSGRIDYASCPEYLYCDTRGQRLTMGALTLTGAAVLTHEDWVIDVYPLDCTDTLEIDPALMWPDRRLPQLRILAFREDVDQPEVLSAGVSGSTITIRPQDDVYRYRITLPEWMVEPGK